MKITLNPEQTRIFLEAFIKEAVELAKKRLQEQKQKATSGS